MAKMGRPTDALKHRFKRILEESNAYQRLQKIISQTPKEDVFLKAIEICHDRAYGKAAQFVDMEVNDNSDRPSTDTLIQTIAALRSELDSLRKGTELATKE